MTSGPPIEGTRLVLRDVQLADVPRGYLTWMNDSDTMQYLESRFMPHSEEDLISYVSAMQLDPAVRLLAVVRREDGRHIGNVKVGPIHEHHRRADIGILIGEPDCRGKGLGTEAISLLSDWAFAELGLEKLTAGAYETNIGSIRAFQRAGFHIEATRARHYVCGDEMVDAVLLARFRPQEHV